MCDVSFYIPERTMASQYLVSSHDTKCHGLAQLHDHDFSFSSVPRKGPEVGRVILSA